MAEKGPSLEEILRGVPPEALDQPCRDKHLCEVARHVTDWPYLAPFLGMSRAEMEEIRGAWPFSVSGQKIEFLRKWQEKRGRKATYRRLCKAFIKVGDVTLAENMCDPLTGRNSSSSEDSEDEGSGLTAPLTDKQEAGSSKVGGPPPPTGPIGLESIHAAPPPPSGGNLLDAGNGSRGSEPSTTLHSGQQPWTSRITTLTPPTRESADKPHPSPCLPPEPSPQHGGEGDLKSKDMEIQELQAQLRREAEATELTRTTQQAQAHQPPRSFHWRRGRDLEFGASKACAIALNGKVYVGGGRAERGQDEFVIQVYSPEKDEWSLLPDCPVKWFAMAKVNQQLVLVGGVNPNPVGRRSATLSSLWNVLVGRIICQTTVLVWDSISHRWTTPYPDMPIQLESHQLLSATSTSWWWQVVIGVGLTWTLLRY